MARMTFRSKIAVVLVGAVSVVTAAVSIGWSAIPAADTPRALQDRIIIAHGADNLPSRTASDWVTYADHVVAVTATAEKETPPAQSELDRGEGLIGRAVTLRIDQVVWSRADAPKAAPSTWVRPSMGWQFTDGDINNRVTVAKADSPRIQAGHSYTIAIVWEENPCSPEGGRWRGLGAGSTVPYDNNRIGEGELEGRERTAEQARQVLDEGGPNIGLKDEMAGKDTAHLASALMAAEPDESRQFAQEPAADTCT
ncbi:hypothetical protein [Streptomyces sp. NPDC057199]|uniref:hypothetical protein n=1 Tax=Streptomyces sp. NPDC057199 TaxID=3346047 RepID=UPI003624FFF0